MVIHHYTKASNLPLILESRKIRFTRADCLDDKSEMPFKTAHLDPRNFFISSWSDKPCELSGLWYRYANHHSGVRISMLNMPFELRNVTIDFQRESKSPSKKVGIQLDDVPLPYSIPSMFGNGYVLVPNSANMQHDFGGKVIYDPDPIAYAEKFISSTVTTTTIVGGTQLGRIKSTPWEDQAEYRFVLYTVAGPQLSYSEHPGNYRTALFDLLETNPVAHPSVDYIDLPVSALALDNVIVTLGSCITEDDRNKVTEAIKEFAPRTKVVESGIKAC